MTDFPHLARPLDLGFVRLRNRTIMGSMHTGLEETGDWDRMAAFYAERARGGVALIVTGGMAPNEVGAVLMPAKGLLTPQDIADHRVVTDAVHAEGGLIAMQILHAGRYAPNPGCVAPSALRSPISAFTPAELSEEGIEAQIADIATAAQRARQAGYDGIELMAGEGYIFSQFLNHLTNLRTDRWGGSAENRSRFTVETVRRIRAAVGRDFLLMVRMSMLELVPGGMTGEEVLDLARALEAAGADMLTTAIGWHEARVPTIATSVPRAAFADMTERVKRAVSIPVAASNRINTPEVAEEILAAGQADLIAMARPFLADPDFVAKALAGQPERITPCIACNQACLDHTFSGRIASCLVNPRACHETEIALAPVAVPRRIAVVGAGPAGLSAAIAAARRGHAVTLFEARDGIGGQLRLAANVPGKEEFRPLLDWFAAEVERLGVRLLTGTRPEAAELADFDAVVVATGVVPRAVDLPGHDLPHVARYDEILGGQKRAGDRVAIIGAGGIGHDVASFLVHDGPSSTLDPVRWRREWGVAPEEGAPGGLAAGGPQPGHAAREVQLFQRSARRIGAGLGKTTGWIHRASLARAEVAGRAGVSYLDITPEGLRLLAADGRVEEVRADTVVICAGQLSDPGPAAALLARGQETHVVGGAARAAELDAKAAINDAVRLAAVL